MLPEEVNGVAITAVLTVTAVVLTYLYLIRNFKVFERAGIPGPKPWPIFGNAMDMNGTNLMTLDLDMRKKYGKFVGTFVGSKPMMMVYDAPWLQEAFIKNFNAFTNRNRALLGGSIDASIIAVEGEHWKHSRKTLSPVFTSMKLKMMLPAMQKCGYTFVSMLKKSGGQPVDVRRMTNMLTLDVISTTAFGIDSNVQQNPDCLFAKNAFIITNSSEANNTLKEKFRLTMAVILTLLAPEWIFKLFCRLFNMALLNPEGVSYFESILDQEVNRREKAAPNYDLLQTMADNVVQAPRNDPDTLVDAVGVTWTRRGLTREETIGNAILFLFAGFQTTADSMMYIFYELAHHPDVQTQLYEEIIAICDTEEITLEHINQLKYLEYCINETLRLYPQGFRFDRIATEDVTVQEVHVAKGTVVVASPWVIHRDSEVWENPEHFDPTRFTPERFTRECSTHFIPFGIGNRQCIGNRMALLEMKMTVILTLKAYKIEKNPLTPSRPIKLKVTVPLTPLSTEQPVMVSYVCRKTGSVQKLVSA